MLRRVSLLSIAAALACCVPLVAVAEAQQGPPLSCIAGPVTVQAMADASGAFPQAVPCPAPNTLEVASCLKWQYVYSLPGGTISVSAISVDSDIDIVAALGGAPGSEQFLPSGGKVYDPGSTDSSIGIGSGVFNMRIVKFAANGSTVLGTIFTETNVTKGTVSAVAKAGNAGPVSCAIAGPDNISGTGVGVAPLTTTETDQFGPCEITLTLNANGCPTDVVAPGCTVTKGVVPNISGGTEISGTFAGGKCGSKITSTGSSCLWYCPTSYGSCFQVCF